MSPNFAEFPGMKACFLRNFRGQSDKSKNSMGIFSEKYILNGHVWTFFWNSPFKWCLEITIHVYEDTIITLHRNRFTYYLGTQGSVVFLSERDHRLVIAWLVWLCLGPTDPHIHLPCYLHAYNTYKLNETEKLLTF